MLLGLFKAPRFGEQAVEQVIIDNIGIVMDVDVSDLRLKQFQSSVLFSVVLMGPLVNGMIVVPSILGDNQWIVDHSCQSSYSCNITVSSACAVPGELTQDIFKMASFGLLVLGTLFHAVVRALMKPEQFKRVSYVSDEVCDSLESLLFRMIVVQKLFNTNNYVAAAASVRCIWPIISLLGNVERGSHDHHSRIPEHSSVKLWLLTLAEGLYMAESFSSAAITTADMVWDLTVNPFDEQNQTIHLYRIVMLSVWGGAELLGFASVFQKKHWESIRGLEGGINVFYYLVLLTASSIDCMQPAWMNGPGYPKGIATSAAVGGIVFYLLSRAAAKSTREYLYHHPNHQRLLGETSDMGSDRDGDEQYSESIRGDGRVVSSDSLSSVSGDNRSVEEGDDKDYLVKGGSKEDVKSHEVNKPRVSRGALSMFAHQTDPVALLQEPLIDTSDQDTDDTAIDIAELRVR